MVNTNVLAVDPGTTTGLAWQFFYDDIIDTDTALLPAEEVLAWIAKRHNFHGINTIVIERFATAGMLSKYGLQTIDLVGQIKGWCYAKDIGYVIQSPQSRKPWTDKAELYPGRKRIIHEIDALAHLLQYLDPHK